ncbi:MAG: transposase [Desulfamplus sp.]|nr:transposase [Desulfamplus sp.]
MDDYKLRWEIETLFGCLKSRGFNFEATHITKLDRIEKLVAVLAIAFSWCHITGEWLHQQKPIKIKNHGRPAISIFRYGLDWLREIVLNLSENKRRYNQVLRLLFRQLSCGAIGVS